MTLLELPCDWTAIITAVTAPEAEEQRLHAIGIYVGSTITKLQHSYSPTRPLCVATDRHTTFAISSRLAATIEISLT
jgi:Fe2+ transport system protein FeoA